MPKIAGQQREGAARQKCSLTQFAKLLDGDEIYADMPYSDESCPPAGYREHASGRPGEPKLASCMLVLTIGDATYNPTGSPGKLILRYYQHSCSGRNGHQMNHILADVIACLLAGRSAVRVTPKLERPAT